MNTTFGTLIIGAKFDLKKNGNRTENAFLLIADRYRVKFNPDNQKGIKIGEFEKMHKEDASSVRDNFMKDVLKKSADDVSKVHFSRKNKAILAYAGEQLAIEKMRRIIFDSTGTTFLNEMSGKIGEADNMFIFAITKSANGIFMDKISFASIEPIMEPFTFFGLGQYAMESQLKALGNSFGDGKCQYAVEDIQNILNELPKIVKDRGFENVVSPSFSGYIFTANENEEAILLNIKAEE